MKHLLKLGGLTPEEITHILDVADEYKRLHRDGIDPKDLQGKAVALIFAKNSTRTRASLEVGIYQMGGLGTYLSANDLQTARGEPVQDTARVLGRYYDAIVCRTYKQTTLDALAKYSGIPVISGMTDYAHPLQVLTDLMTVRERKGRVHRRRLQHGEQRHCGLPCHGYGGHGRLPEALPPGSRRADAGAAVRR